MKDENAVNDYSCQTKIKNRKRMKNMNPPEHENVRISYTPRPTQLTNPRVEIGAAKSGEVVWQDNVIEK